MISPVASFLEFAFRSLFRNLLPKWGHACEESFAQAADLVRSDVSVMCPSLPITSDFEEMVVTEMEVNASLTAAVLYRIERQLFLCDPKHPALGPLAHLMRVRTGMEIYYSTAIGPRLNIQHGMGVVIGPRNQIGSDFTVHQGVTLGQRRLGCPEEYISIGDRVAIFAGARILGRISVGSDVKIAANAVLDSTYAGIPAKRVR